MPVSSDDQQKERWQKKFPSKIGGVLSVVQMFLTFAITGCEVGVTLVQFPRMNAFVGYWTFPFFMCA